MERFLVAPANRREAASEDQSGWRWSYLRAMISILITLSRDNIWRPRAPDIWNDPGLTLNWSTFTDILTTWRSVEPDSTKLVLENVSWLVTFETRVLAPRDEEIVIPPWPVTDLSVQPRGLELRREACGINGLYGVVGRQHYDCMSSGWGAPNVDPQRPPWSLQTLEAKPHGNADAHI